MESCHIHEDAPPMKKSRHTVECVMSHIWSGIVDIYESCEDSCFSPLHHTAPQFNALQRNRHQRSQSVPRFLLLTRVLRIVAIGEPYLITYPNLITLPYLNTLPYSITLPYLIALPYLITLPHCNNAHNSGPIQ